MDFRKGPLLRGARSIVLIFASLWSCNSTFAQIAGTNVNMVSGTQWPGGDPFLQRQNEPSLAVSSRNPFHLLAGANDYRSVDLALTTNGETGDAWLGLFKSLDGGATWRSVLLPGCPYNTSICAGAPSVQSGGYAAAADPTVRAGSNGMFYYSGLVFNRGLNPASAIIVSRLIDLNNKENADPNDILNGDSIQYLSTSIVATGTPSSFLDKPTMAVDVPRWGANACNLSVNQPGNGVVNQTFAAGNVYVAYTAFQEAPNTDPENVTGPQLSKLYFVRSTNCGATWSKPLAISGNIAINQGTSVAIDPNLGTVYVAWREFHYQSGNINQPDAIVVAASFDGGRNFTPPLRISTFTPFDEGTTATSFRTNAYPTIAVDDSSLVYVAYAARNTVPSGDARIVLTDSFLGFFWSKPVPIDNPPVDPIANPSGRGHQIMPALTFAGGKLSLLYYDLRLDHTYGLYTPLLNLGQPTGLYSQFPELAGELALNPPDVNAVFNQFIDDSTIALRRHTFDLRMAQALPGAAPVFAPSVLVSQYAYGCCAVNQTDIEQMQFNVPNLPLFKSGTAPFMGDYVDLTAGPTVLPPTAKPGWEDPDGDSDDWHFNTSTSTPTTFHAAWTDNRDVQPPADGDWTHYTPPNSPSLGTTSIFEPGTAVPACQPGFTGSRNQNIYTAPISGGLIFGAPSNAKTLGTTVFNGTTVPFQRAFVVVAQNTTELVKSFRLTIVNQPPGGSASFLQFSLLTTLDLSIPPMSSASRPVFVVSTDSTASVTINIAEITAPQGTLVANGLTGSTTLNPDATNPGITNPTEANPGITNPGITNFEVTNPGITNPGITNPTVTNPGITNPGITNPGITNSTFQNETVVNPGITNPGITNPGITNASIATPGITNPGITNVNPANVSISDTQWTVINNGNTTGAYTLNLASSSTVPQGNVLQLIISKLYQTPAAPTGTNCNLAVQTHYGIVTNIVNPAVLSPTNPGITNPGITNPGITNATVSLAPGETANIDVRVINTDVHTFPTFNPSQSILPVVVSQSVNTQQALASGGTGTGVTPPITVPPLIVTTTTLPDGVTGAVYTAAIGTQGGNPTAHTFAVAAGALPAGLTINATTGAITGIPTTVGTSTFTIQVQDAGSPGFPQNTATQQLSIRISAPLTVTTAPALASATQGGPYSQLVATTGGVGPFTLALVSGALPAGLTMNSAGVIAGTPTGTGTSTFTVQVTDSSNPPQVTTQTFTITVTSTQVPAVVSFVTQPQNTIGGQVLTGSPVVVKVTDSTGAVIPNFPVTIGFNGTPPCAAATLGGTLSATTDATGQASFGNLAVNFGQFGYTLLATAANAFAVSSAFNIEGYCNTGSVNVGRHNHDVIALPNGKVLVAGGAVNPDNTGALSSAELYDPATKTFTALGNMNAARVDFTMTLLQSGHVLITGGFNDNGILSSAELFDPTTNAFTLLPEGMTSPRAEHVATLLANGKVLVTGGNATQTVTLASAEIFDPATGIFTPTSHPMNAIRQIHHADLLPNGLVLVEGGFDTNGNPLASAELYDPVADTFTLTGSMNVARGNHASVLLDTSRVLVAGGLAVAGTGLARTTSAELYDPSTGIWTITGSMTTPRAHYFGNTLSDGTIFIPGTAVLPGGNNADIYDPVAGTFRATANFTIDSTGEHEAVLQDGTVLLASGVDSNTVVTTNAEIFYPLSLPTSMSVLSTTLANATENTPYTQLLFQRGGVGPLTWTVASGALPPGLTLSTSGIVTGTPTASGTFTFAAQVTDSATPQKTATSGTLTITVAGVPLQFTSNNLPPAGTGRFYSQALPIIGGRQPYTVTQTSGTLPPGLSLSGNGALAGTPSTSGSFTFTVQAVDSSTTKQTATQTFTIAVDTLFITTTALPNGIVNVSYNAPISTAGGTLPLSFSLANTAFPPGLMIHPPAPTSQTGALAGIPTQAGTFEFSESVVDSSNPTQAATQNYVVTIAPAGTTAPAHVTFVTQPLSSVGGQTLAGGPIVVSVTDANNAPISDAIVVMSFNGAPPCASAILNGALETVTGANGQATFSNLSIDRGQFGYALLASAGSASAVSTPFPVQGFCESGNLSTQREGHTQDLLGSGKVLIAGGVDNNGNALNTAELYDPATGTTSPTGNLTDPNGRADHVSVVLANGKVLLAGGGSNVSNLATAELYDPATGTFTATGSMSEPRFYSAAVLLPDGRVLVTGGFNTNVASNRAEIYDPATGLFTRTGDLNEARGRHTMTLLANGKVLVTGGRDAQGNFVTLSSAELFDPSANQGAGAFTLIGNMNSPRSVHTATLLSNGTVLIAGGFNGGNTSLAVTSTEIFDPSTNTFTLTGSMSIPRARQTSTLLPDGTVLEAGGINSFQGVTAPAPSEIYSPTSASFAQTGAMITGRELPRATQLFNGNVLVSGGDDGVNVLASIEVYYNTVVKEPIAITTTSVPNGFISQPYVQLLLAQNTSGPITWSLASGTLPAGITLGANGFLTGTPTATGSFTFTVQVTDGTSTAGAAFTINVSLTSLVFTSNFLPSGGVGRAYSQPLPVTGGTLPYTASVTGGNLPPGLGLSSQGTLGGTPSVAGSFTFTVTVTDASTPVQSATGTLTVLVDALFITTTALPNGTVSVPYNALISTAGGTLPLSFSPATAAFPPGLTIQQVAGNPQSVLLVGTPTTVGHYTFTEQVIDSSSPVQGAVQPYTMDVLPAGSSATPATLTFLSQPQNSIGGQILGGSPVRVHVADANNFPVAGASVALSFNGAPPCSSAVLSGTLNGITNGAGNAFFPDLSIDRGQLGYTLLASAGSASAVSQPFTVNGFCDTGNMATARTLHNSVALPNGSVLVAGGSPSFSNRAVAFSSAELYNPATHSFTAVGSMHAGRSAFSMTLLQNGLVLVAGGFGGTASLSSAELFDPATNTFTLLSSSLTTPRSQGIATLLANGKVLITGGDANGVALASAEIFDPATNTFTATSRPMMTPRELHEAVLLPNGKVLITGGFSTTGPSNALASAEIYDPVADTFTSTGGMTTPRYEHASALLFTGKVLVAGGFSGNGFTTPLAVAEIYDPSTGTFSSTANALQQAAGFLGAVPVLPDGTVFLAGAANAQTYDPAAGIFQVTGNTTTIQAQPLTSLLADGTVLVTGGVGSPTFNIGVPNAETYYSTAPLAPLSITTTSLFGAVVGKPYTQMLLEQGGVGTLTWTVASGSLPPGITLRSDGVLIGTPTTTGTFTFAARVVDSSTPQKSVVSGNFILTVASALTIPAQTFNTGVVGTPYGGAITASGGTPPYSFAITSGATPAGVTLSSNGQFTGTPTTPGTSSFTVTVTDSAVPPQTASQTFSIQVVNPLAISTAALPGGSVGVPYSATISSTGGGAPVNFVVGAGTLPTGLVLAGNGVISGTPTSAGSFTFTVSATDSSTPTQTALQSYTVTIAPAAIGPAATINFITQPTATTAGQPISPAVQLKVVDGNGSGVPGATVTLGMGAAQNRPILSGTLSAVTDATGVATFSNVVLDRGGTGYALVASVAVTSNSGAVQLISAPASVAQGALESDTQIQLFAEQGGVTLSAGVTADITAPGSYSTAASLTSGTIPAGTKVDSYYLHADPVGISRNVVQLLSGGVTFPTNVLGVIILDPNLTASNPALGVVGMQYPTTGRGLTLGSPTDTVILSADQRTLTLHLSGSNATKDVRVLTVANSGPNLVQVASAPFNSVAAVGSITTVAGSTWVFPGVGVATSVPLGLAGTFTEAYSGMVSDASGNIYFPDLSNHIIFKLSGTALSIVAGTGIEGYAGDGGVATSARLDSPQDVALSPAGDLYIADTGNSVIRKVDSAGNLTTFAGNGTSAESGDGGPATSASLAGPSGIAFDAAGNLFIADNGTIREVNTSGTISTVALTPIPAGTPSLCAPQGLRRGPDGSIYVADFCNRVFKFNSSGSLTLVAGNGNENGGYAGDGGPATSALLSDPSALAFDGQGNLYIADELNNVIREVNAAGIISTVAGTGAFGYAGDGGPGTAALLDQPGGLAFDAGGSLYVADMNNERIRKLDTTNTITTVAGNGRFKYAGDGGAATSASLDSPVAVALDPTGNLYAADIANTVVRKVNPAGVISTYVGTGIKAPTYTGDGGPATSATISFPGDVQADSASNLFLSEGDRIHKINFAGTITTLFNGGAPTVPQHLALDRQGNVYFVAPSLRQVLKLDTSGTVSVAAGTGLAGFSGDGGPATSARLGNNTRGLAVDGAGNLFIADGANQRVRKVDTNGTITTVAGNGNTTTSGDGGPATGAGVPGPFTLVVDGAGSLYITSDNRVRKVDANGTISTIAGAGFIGSTVDGVPASNATFNVLQGIAFDSAGNLYVGDRFDDRVRRITGVTNAPPFIFNPPSGLTVATKGLPHGTVGTTYFQTLSAVGGASPYTWSISSGSLPAGLSLSSAGAISGTPTSAGAFTFAVQATDSVGAIATQSITITINSPLALAPQTLPGGVVGAAYTASLAARSYLINTFNALSG